MGRRGYLAPLRRLPVASRRVIVPELHDREEVGVLGYIDPDAAGLLVAASVAIITLLIDMGFRLWAIIDAAQRPEKSFEALNSTKTLWIVLLIFVPFVDFYYLFVFRAKLKVAQASL